MRLGWKDEKTGTDRERPTRLPFAAKEDDNSPCRSSSAVYKPFVYIICTFMMSSEAKSTALNIIVLVSSKVAN